MKLWLVKCETIALLQTSAIQATVFYTIKCTAAKTKIVYFFTIVLKFWRNLFVLNSGWSWILIRMNFLMGWQTLLWWITFFRGRVLFWGVLFRFGSYWFYYQFVFILVSKSCAVIQHPLFPLWLTFRCSSGQLPSGELSLQRGCHFPFRMMMYSEKVFIISFAFSPQSSKPFKNWNDI